MAKCKQLSIPPVAPSKGAFKETTEVELWVPGNETFMEWKERTGGLPARPAYTGHTGHTGYTGQNGYTAPREAAVTPASRAKMEARFDTKQLRRRCKQTIPQIFKDVCARGGVLHGTPGQQYVYQNNGASVLAVAHCDWVQNCKQQFGTLKLGGAHMVFSPQLDDRLGVYTILDLLPALNIRVDVLLTEGEETGKSTAKLFTTAKHYKWIVEFDRRGSDAVVYRYDNDPWKNALKTQFCMGHGSFSDISTMENLGVSAFNMGIAYTGEHSNQCHMDVASYCNQMVRFRRFWKEYHKVTFPHVPSASRYGNGRGGYGGGDAYGAVTGAGWGVGNGMDDSWWENRYRGRNEIQQAARDNCAGVASGGSGSTLVPPVKGVTDLPGKKNPGLLPPALNRGSGSCTGDVDSMPLDELDQDADDFLDDSVYSEWVRDNLPPGSGTASPSMYECSHCLDNFYLDEAVTIDVTHIQCPQCGSTLLLTDEAGYPDPLDAEVVT